MPSPNPNPGTVNELFGVDVASSGDVWAVGNTLSFAYRTLAERISCSQPAPTMHVGGIQVGSAQGQVGARITVEDGNGAAVAGAVVAVDVTLPDQSHLARSATTSSTGLATVAVPVTLHGTYTFTVTSVSKAGFTYDPSANVETSKSVLVP